MASMKYRKLRIAWSVVWGILCLLLVVLWVRSYWWVEALYLPVPRYRAVGVGIIPGSLAFDIALSETPWRTVHIPADDWLDERDPPSSRFWGFFEVQAKTAVVVPFWFLLVTIASVGTIPWLRQLPYQFSLRTLLIAMTLVAVALGAIVYAVR
jgi:hypothetical protein